MTKLKPKPGRKAATAPPFGTAKAQPLEAMLKRPPLLVGPKELPSLGINYSSTHLRRMWKAGKFPKPVYPSERRFAWPLEVLEDWIASFNT
jgi:hypothetical protein